VSCCGNQPLRIAGFDRSKLLFFPFRWGGAASMPIIPFLQGQAFDPELIAAMGNAFDNHV
jgi:hypothetical protein